MSMTAETQIQPLDGADNRRQAFALFRQAMLGLPDLGRADPEGEARYLADGKPLGLFEGGVLSGVANGYASQIALPGGQRVRHLSVTHVGVAPQATRRGVASRLLVEQLRRAKADGYVVAGLRASDSRIYGRYGYGIASWSVRQELDLSRASLAVPAIREGLRFVDAYQSFDLFKRISDSSPTPRAAALSRWDGWWAMQELRVRHAGTPHYAVVFAPHGAERGFLRFHIEPSDNWFTSPRRSIVVDDLVAHDGEAWRSLIGHLFSQDILHRAVFPSCPADDPLPLLVTDPRAIEVSGLRDESWVRPLDLAALLNGRSYQGTEAVVVDVDDPIIPENSGKWRIGPDGVAKSNEASNAWIGIGDLASLIFGAQGATALATSGRLVTSSDAATVRLDSLFRTERKPHAGISF